MVTRSGLTPLGARLNFPFEQRANTNCIQSRLFFPRISLCSHRGKNSNVMKIPEGLDNRRLLCRVKRYFRQHKRSRTAEHEKGEDSGVRPATKELSLAKKGARSLSVGSIHHLDPGVRWKRCTCAYVSKGFCEKNQGGVYATQIHCQIVS